MKSISRRLLATFALVTALAIPMAAVAGIIFVPIGEFIPTSVGENKIKSNGGGEYVLTNVGMTGSFFVVCNGAPGCVEAGLDGSQVELNQDLRIVIDFTSAGITGVARGTLSGITLPDTVKYQGDVEGALSCQPSNGKPCGLATIYLQIPVALLGSTDDKFLGMMDLHLEGTVAPGSGSSAWLTLISPQAEIAQVQFELQMATSD